MCSSDFENNYLTKELKIEELKMKKINRRKHSSHIFPILTCSSNYINDIWKMPFYP